MRIFDLHCDTISECFNQKKPLLKNDLHLDIERCCEYEEYIQVFAVWIPDSLMGEKAKEYFNSVCDFYYNELEKNKEHISDLFSQRNTKIKSVLALEGGSGCGGEIEGVYELYSKGVRVITLTWNGCNEIATGAFSEGGITAFGKEFIKECDKLGIVLDASHLNEQSFRELAELYKKPFIASHSNADIVENFDAHRRNLNYEQIELIKNRKGLIGINYCKDFLETQGKEGITAFKAQLDYFLSVGCEDVIALGSDYDGCEIHSDLCGVEKLGGVHEALLNDGYSRQLLDKLFYKNAKDFFYKFFNEKEPEQ